MFAVLMCICMLLCVDRNIPISAYVYFIGYVCVILLYGCMYACMYMQICRQCAYIFVYIYMYNVWMYKLVRARASMHDTDLIISSKSEKLTSIMYASHRPPALCRML